MLLPAKRESGQYQRQVKPAIGLRACYAMPGTGRGCGATCIRTRCAMPGTDDADGPTRDVQKLHHCWDVAGTLYICLRACYAVFGTDVAYAAICLHAFYAVSSTDIAYAPTVVAGASRRGTLASYGSPSDVGTDIAYAAVVLRGARYWYRLCCYEAAVLTKTMMLRGSTALP
eukprot:3940643-Rhodomonas_salina.8